MVRGIGVANLCFLQVDLEDSEVSDQPGIDAIDTHISHRLILSSRLAIQGRDIRYITLDIHQINV